MENNIIIGICGGTGSGKTTLARRIAEHFGEEALLYSMDNYYNDLHHIEAYEERAKINYDHPDAFDMTLLHDHLAKLKQGESVLRPTYDFTVHNRGDEWVRIYPKRVIVMEGILLFAYQEIVDLLDVKIFVDADPDVRICRRIMRDVKERERSVDSVISQYLSTVKPMHEQYIEPFKRLADVVVQDGRNPIACNMIVDTIDRMISK